MDFFDRVLSIVVAAGIIVAAYVITLSVAEASAQAKCLAAGWPSAKVDYALTKYCVRRVDQTDVVVPLRDIKR